MSWARPAGVTTTVYVIFFLMIVLSRGSLDCILVIIISETAWGYFSRLSFTCLFVICFSPFFPFFPATLITFL